MGGLHLNQMRSCFNFFFLKEMIDQLYFSTT